MEQLAHDLFSEVLLILNGDDDYLRKKACLTMIRMLSKAPDLIDGLVRSIPVLLVDNDHGVLISGTVNYSSFTLAIQLTLVILDLLPTISLVSESWSLVSLSVCELLHLVMERQNAP